MIQQEKRFDGLDHLRSLAISMVFLFHYQFFPHPAWMDNTFSFGWTGVDLFFILSGFLISNQLFKEIQQRSQINLRSFYIKRACRILPPYLFILLIYIFIPAFHEREQLSPLWKMFTFVQNFGLNIAVYGTFSHSWSLCVEEQFYLILPFLLFGLLLIRRFQKAGWLIPAIFLFTMILRWLIWQFHLIPLLGTDDFNIAWYQWIYYPTFSRLDGLITGVAIASLYRFRENWFQQFNHYANYFLFAALLLIIGYFILNRDGHSGFSTIFGFSLVALFYGLMVLSAILPKSLLYHFKSRISSQLATLSYSLYLCHKGIIHLTQGRLEKLGLKSDSSWTFLICLATCICFALGMRLLIEKPFFRWRNKLLSPSRVVSE